MENYNSNISTIKKLRKRVVNNIEEAINLDEIERLAFSKLDMNALSYFMSGANDEISLLRNKNYFRKILMYPKILKNVFKTDTSTTILGESVAMPVLIAPTAFHCLAHPEGELATAKASLEMNTIYVLSNLATKSMKEVADVYKDNKDKNKDKDNNRLKWFQLYVMKDVDYTKNVLKLVEENGYTGLVITVDAPVLGSRERDFMIKFKLPSNIKYENLIYTKTNLNKQKSEEMKSEDKETESKSEIFEFFAKNMDSTLTWDAIKWIKQNTKLKIILKGIHRVDDSIIAQQMGIDAIIVSNHGARQLDTVPSGIEMLYSISKALRNIPDNKMEIYVDGGIRRGSDVFKALALGAKAVFLGRPIVWGLAADGKNGVKKVLTLIKNEFTLTMKLSGVSKVEDINEDYVRLRENFPKF